MRRKPMIVFTPVVLCGLLALMLFSIAVLFGQGEVIVQGQAAPSPTVPSWNKPNLHLYFVNGSGLHLRLYDVKTDANDPLNPDKTQLIKVWEGVTNGQGYAAFDATTIVCDRMYYLEVLEADGKAVLPFDPNALPRPATGQPLNPKTRTMAIVSLTKGSIVYVKRWTVKPLVESVSNASRALTWPGESWDYWPNGQSDLLSLPQPTTQSSGAGGSNTTAADTGNPIITNAVQRGIGVITPAPGATSNPTATGGYGSVQSTPTPECRYCNKPTDNPQTLAYYLTGSGRGGGGKLTPTPYPPGVLTQRAERAITDAAHTGQATEVASATNSPAAIDLSPRPIEAGVSSPQPGGTIASTTNNPQEAANGFPWLLLVLGLAVLLVGIVATVFLLRRGTKRS